MFRALLGLAVAAGIFATDAKAQDQQRGTYIIYDSSNSMWGALPDDTRKYEAARRAMRELAAGDFAGSDVALRMYGHRRKDDCSDSELVVPWTPGDAIGPDLISAMEAVRPTGRTPIDRSLRAALKDFGGRSGTIVLISDGIESCDADPCALVQAWRDRDVDIAVHVVGLGLRGKERAAMECIAKASGTEYQDAFSAEELIAGIGAAVEAAEPGPPLEPGTSDPKEQVSEAALRLDILTPDGEARRGRAIFTPLRGGDDLIVDSEGRFIIPAGDYRVSAGVLTIDGSIYRPVTREVTVGFDGADMSLVIEDVPKPPEVSARFSMAGDALRETVVIAYIEGKKVGSFHGDMTAFVPEGEIEFRATPAGTSQELSVTERFAKGDAKQIRFEAAREVHLLIRLHLGESGEQLLAKPAVEMHQNGERVAKLNRRSGGLIFPGDYKMIADDGLMRFEQYITVTDAPEQVVDITLPAGALVVRYLDVNGDAEAAKRVFLYPSNGRGGVTRRSDEMIALLPGAYIVEGHPKRAEYPKGEVVVEADKLTEITLQATKAP